MNKLVPCGTTNAQLVASVLSPQLIGQKAIVRFAMVNEFAESIESARAVVFLMDEQRKMVSTSTRWVIGGQNG